MDIHNPFVHMNPSSKSVRKPHRARCCAICKTRDASAWRKGPNGETLCNSCGLRYRRRQRKNTLTVPVAQPFSLSNISSASPILQWPTSFGSFPYLQELPNAAWSPDVSTAFEFPNIPARAGDSSNKTTSGLVTGEPSMLSSSDHRLDTVCKSGGCEIVDRPSHEHDNADYYSLNQNFDDGDLTEESSTPQDSPHLTRIQVLGDPTPHTLQPDDILFHSATGSLEFDPVQVDGEANHHYGPIQQDDWAGWDEINYIALEHNQDTTQTEYSPSMSQSEEPSFDGLSAVFASSKISEISRESCHASSSSDQGTHLLVEYRQRRGASSPGLMSSQSPFSVHKPLADMFTRRNGCLFDTQPQSGQQIGSKVSDHFHPSSGYTTGTTRPENIQGSQCTCWHCILKSFHGCTDAIPMELPHNLQMQLSMFFCRTASVHGNALSRGSSIYAATETFIYENAGEHFRITAFAVIREDLELVQSHSEGRPMLSAAACDLVFDYVITGAPAYPTPLDDWLHGQSLIKHLSSERAKSAIWDVSRLLPGHHVPDSATFQWLQRTFVTVDTRSGPQITMNVQSGSDKHGFRGFYEIYECIKYTNIPELRALLEPDLQAACVKCCQEWFIAVLDEAAKQPTEESQLQFLEANKLYMINSMNLIIRLFQKMNVKRALHICTFDCNSHVQPSFQSLLCAARDALRNLFSPPEGLLRYIRETPATYPTREQLFLCRVVGLTQHKIYFTSKLLSKDRQREHAIHTRPGLAKLRLELVEKTQSNLVWNYLIGDIAQRAAAKRERAIDAFKALPV